MHGQLLVAKGGSQPVGYDQHMEPRPRTDNASEDLRRSLLTAFDLHAAGVEMTRLRLRRKHPHLEEAAIEDLVAAWLSDAEPMAGSGCRAIAWPRARP